MPGLGAKGSGFHDARGDEIFEPLRKDIWSNTEASLKVGEPPRPAKQRITQDEQTPSLADDFERSRCRAALLLVEASQHEPIVLHELA